MASYSLPVRDKGIALNALKPTLRAFLLGYITSTTPRLLPYTRNFLRRGVNNQTRLRELLRTLLSTIGIDRFPTVCAILVAGSTCVPLLCDTLYSLILRKWRGQHGIRLSRASLRVVRLVATFISAWIGFVLLNRRSERSQRFQRLDSQGKDQNHNGSVHQTSIEHHPKPLILAGRTLDLTLFLSLRAVDVIGCLGWAWWRNKRKLQHRWTGIESKLPELADASLFIVSAAIVMWTWFYMPKRLPKAYEKWIGEAAQVDHRLIEALRRCRMGLFVYGKDTGQAPLLQSMCAEYGWPNEWGDPAKTIPIPCEMVHMGCGPSCEWHAVSRFYRAFKFSYAMYFPLQLLVRIRSKQPLISISHAAKEAARSSSFLALFISFFYYSVCLARTRLGPRLFSPQTITPSMWDSGIDVGAGCMACGWSIFVESPRRRQEIAFFVAPRAAATLLPRRYPKEYQYREQIACTISAAIILTCIQERPEMVRGVLGRILTSVIN